MFVFVFWLFIWIVYFWVVDGVVCYFVDIMGWLFVIAGVLLIAC